MFLKPYKVKSNAPLKSSDTKRLRQQLETAFPNVTPEQLQVLLPSKSNVSVLKLVTHSNFQTNVFCVDKLPMFFETEAGVLAPTLYAIWQVAELLPYFTTIPAVLPKLSNGADLMLPGVVPQGTGMNIYGRYKSAQLVAVNLTSNNAAVGIGYLPRSSDDLYMCGGHGSAVKMLHIFGDKLWGHEPALVQQVPNQKPNDLTTDDFPALGLEAKGKAKPQLVAETIPKSLAQQIAHQNASNMTKEDFPALGLEVKRKEKPLPIAEPKTLANIVVQKDTEQSDEDPTQTSYSECDKLSTHNETESSSTEVSPEELLKNAFLAALKNHGKTLQLPLLTSNFFRLYVVTEAVQPIDLKKTKYKKLSNFLAQMIDEGFIVVREETKGVDKITSIDFEHPELVNFITDFKRPSAANDASEQESPLFHSELTELYIVTDATAAFFTKMNYKRGEGIPAAQIKKIVREYISKQNLPVADVATKSVRLDEMLQQFCNCTAAPLSKICNAVLLKMEHSYQMCSVRDVTSNKPLIQMSLATRSGNKKVTLVSNVECYGIILPEFIKLCKQGAAASTTIVKLPNQKREQLQIQGNQVRFIHTLLTETYKVPPKCILGLELAKDGKKHKKK